MADEERTEDQQAGDAEAEATVEETPSVEAEASESPSEPDPETPPEEPGPPVPEPTPPEPPEPAPEPIEVAEGEPETQAAAEGEEAGEAEGAVEEKAAPPSAAGKKRKRVPRSERRQRPKQRELATERKPITRLPKPEHERGRRQERRGVVVSAAMDKTIVVRVDVVKAHPKYKKVVRRSQRFHAHDEQNQAKAGDVVRIVETRPLSKTKHWRLAEVVEAAK